MAFYHTHHGYVMENRVIGTNGWCRVSKKKKKKHDFYYWFVSKYFQIAQDNVM